MQACTYRRLATLALALCVLLAGSLARAGDYGEPGPYRVAYAAQRWTDPARGRVLPIRIAFPVGASGARPVILFSHGLGGSVNAGAKWSDHWASYGFIVVHLQHPGSDDSVWRDVAPAQRMAAMKRAANPATFVDRVTDVRFAIDELARRKATDAVLRDADLARIGMSGHSYGAVTTQVASGERWPVIGDGYKDARIRAAIAFSPSARSAQGGEEVRFAGISIPFFSITGTADTSPLDASVTPASRTLPYRSMPPPDKYLLVLEGANHMVFSGGEGRGRTVPDQAAMNALVEAGSVAFWLAHLSGDAEARAWLAGGRYAAAVGTLGTFSAK